MAIPANRTRLEARHSSIQHFRVVGLVLATTVLFLAAAFANDPALEEELSDPRPYQWVFGNRFDAAAAHKQLDMLLSERIAIVDRICNLTDAQKQKLELAGRRDNRELDDRIAEIAVKLVAVKEVNELRTEAESLQRRVMPGLFEEGSGYLIKTLKGTLTAKQHASFAPLRSVFRAGGRVGLWQRGNDELLGVIITQTTFSDDDLAELSELRGIAVLYLAGTQVGDPGLAHLERLPGLEKLYLGQTKVTDAGLQHLRELTTMRELNLVRTAIAGPGLVHLKGLKNLQSLNLGSTQVSDADLEHLKGLMKLEHLKLFATNVTDAGLVHIEGLVNLRSLGVAGTGITDAGLRQVIVLKQLQWLGLGKTRITDSGLERLKVLTDLQGLALDDTEVTDTGLEHLKALTGLEELWLSNTHVTDAGLEHLKLLRNLERVSLGGTQVTNAGIADFERAFPRLDVERK